MYHIKENLINFISAQWKIFEYVIYINFHLKNIQIYIKRSRMVQNVWIGFWKKILPKEGVLLCRWFQFFSIKWINFSSKYIFLVSEHSASFYLVWWQGVDPPPGPRLRTCPQLLFLRFPLLRRAKYLCKFILNSLLYHILDRSAQLSKKPTEHF